MQLTNITIVIIINILLSASWRSHTLFSFKHRQTSKLLGHRLQLWIWHFVK